MEGKLRRQTQKPPFNSTVLFGCLVRRKEKKTDGYLVHGIID